MDSIFRIVATGLLGSASACLSLLAFYGYSKITGSKFDFSDSEAYKAGLPFLFWVLFAVVAFFTMFVNPGIQGLAHVLRRLVV